MIDTHSHIYLQDFDEDRDEIMKRAAEAGVEKIFMPAIDLSSIELMNKLDYHGIGFYKMAGIHPCDVRELADDFEKELEQICAKKEIYGVGETGLDYYWSTDAIALQKESFRIHCKVAKAVDKPVIIHNRESTDDMLKIVEEEQDGRLKGIWHCFNGSEAEGRRALESGLHLGIGGVLTFKNAGVDKTVARLPLEKMVLETDAPYLAPAPKRGKRNEPSFMKYTAQKLAEVFETTFEQIDEITTQTAIKLFKIDE